GSNWRCEGRSTVQKRLPSLKPAETKIRRRTWAPDEDCAATIVARATSNTNTTARETLRPGCTKVERRIGHPHERWFPMAEAASVRLFVPAREHDTPVSRDVNPCGTRARDAVNAASRAQRRQPEQSGPRH